MKPDPLSKIPLFEHLSARERRKVADALVETRYRKDRFIFREGDPARSFHILKEGTVKCVKTSPEGKQGTLKVLMPGDLFCCDAAAFEGAHHPGTAQPMGDVSILRMNKKSYFEMLRRNPRPDDDGAPPLRARWPVAWTKRTILPLGRTWVR